MNTNLFRRSPVGPFEMINRLVSPARFSIRPCNVKPQPRPSLSRQARDVHGRRQIHSYLNVLKLQSGR